MKYDIAVIGLGPGGLAAALRAAKDGKSVVAFTDRNEYVRQQRIVITQENIAFLKEFSNADDEDFFKKIAAEPYDSNCALIQTKDVERYMYRKLEEFSQQNPNRVTIIQSDKDKKAGGLSIEKDPDNNFSIKTSAGDLFEFNHLLAADGARHDTASMVQRDLDKKINYNIHTYQERSKYQAAVQLRLKPGRPPPTTPRDFIAVNSKMNEYGAMGWKETFPPQGYQFANAEKNKFSFAGEIPGSIFKMSDPVKKKEALKDWASCRIAAEYGLSPEDLEFKTTTKKESKTRLQAKISLQATAFEMVLVTSDKPLIELDEKSTSVFCQTGDARRTPDFYLGHGLNHALTIGILFANSVQPNGDFDKATYINTIEQIDSILDSRIKDKAIMWQQYELYSLINQIPDDRKDTMLTKLLDEKKIQIAMISNIDEYVRTKKEVTDLKSYPKINSLLAICNNHESYLQNVKANLSRKTIGFLVESKLAATIKLRNVIEEGKKIPMPENELLVSFQNAFDGLKGTLNDGISTSQENDFISKIFQSTGQAKPITNIYKNSLTEIRKNPGPNYNLEDDSRIKLGCVDISHRQP